ncbi:hypothetical protein BRAS3809_3930002 [Bradyrhizobium sp. STM 3809]|nr:hypothetical protein BRAS3809_3930002 [Bradyrhizobium sp. STM 3809]
MKVDHLKLLLMSHSVMPGFVPGIHVEWRPLNRVDGRDKPGQARP